MDKKEEAIRQLLAEAHAKLTRLESIVSAMHARRHAYQADELAMQEYNNPLSGYHEYYPMADRLYHQRQRIDELLGMEDDHGDSNTGSTDSESR